MFIILITQQRDILKRKAILSLKCCCSTTLEELIAYLKFQMSAMHISFSSGHLHCWIAYQL